MRKAARRFREVKITNLFIFIGATLCTEWLGELVDTDSGRLIRTGMDIDASKLMRCTIYKNRKPQSMETEIAGFFLS